MSITYRKGDATAPPERPAIIAHICNDSGMWGAGFVLALSRRWTTPEYAYRSITRHKLGHVQIVKVASQLRVANMIAQGPLRHLGPLVRYDALLECLYQLDYPGYSIHMPRIGCGIGGGWWRIVESLIDTALPDHEVYVYDL